MVYPRSGQELKPEHSEIVSWGGSDRSAVLRLDFYSQDSVIQTPVNNTFVVFYLRLRPWTSFGPSLLT